MDALTAADLVAQAFHEASVALAPEFGFPADRSADGWAQCPLAYRLWLRAVIARLTDAGFIVTPERAAVLAAATGLAAAARAFDAALLGPSVTCAELTARPARLGVR